MEGLSLQYLSGPRQGETHLVVGLPATLGSGATLDVPVPGAAPRHLMLFARGRDLMVRDLGSGIGTFLAGQHIEEAALRDGDVLELGAGGPRLQVHLPHQPMLPQALLRRLRETSVGFRWSLVLLAVGAGLFLAWGRRESRRLHAEVAVLEAVLRRAETERRAFERRVENERLQTLAEGRRVENSLEQSRLREEELQRRLLQAAGSEDVAGVRDDLARTRQRLGALEDERAAGERIIKQYGDGVCLIQGAYAFYDGTNRPLRYAVDEDGKPVVDSEGAETFTVEGVGPVHTVDYFGTGFLVDRRGLVLSNRHVAEPWWRDDAAEAWGKRGFTPRFVLFRAFFPRQPEAFALQQIRHAAEAVDLTLLQIEAVPARLPVLPLARSARDAVAGQPVVVVGYPTGLEAILAKADPREVRQIIAIHGASPERMTSALARLGLIRPSTTQGHIGDITRTDIVFDAPTTQGGSGGPVFNKNGQVVAVEYAVLTKFGGNAFGVPIAHAFALLRR